MAIKHCAFAWIAVVSFPLMSEPEVYFHLSGRISLSSPSQTRLESVFLIIETLYFLPTCIHPDGLHPILFVVLCTRTHPTNRKMRLLRNLERGGTLPKHPMELEREQLLYPGQSVATDDDDVTISALLDNTTPTPSPKTELKKKKEKKRTKCAPTAFGTLKVKL